MLSNGTTVLENFEKKLLQMITLCDVRVSSSFPKRLRMYISLHGNAGKKFFSFKIL